jgi:putative thioredoxin
MSDSPYIVEVTSANFESVILQGSMERPILIDFWADWCEPCKTLIPILEKLADEYQGGFILAKVDTDAEQMIAQQLGIRSLPTVKLVIQGQMVDEFSGALPEGEVRAFLEKHIQPAGAQPENPNDPVEVAKVLQSQGQHDQAMALLREAQAADPENGDVAIQLGLACVAAGNYDDARQCLGILKEDDGKKPEAAKLRGLLTLSDADDESRDEAALAAALDADKGDSEAAYLLGIKQALKGEFETSVNGLLLLMQRDRAFGDDGARKAILSIFDIMGDDPQVGVLRRKMFNYLH